MKAIRIHQIGGPEALSLDEIELGKPSEDQTRIRVELAGVNFIDVYHRRGQYQVPLPCTLGIEGIGRSETGDSFFWLSAMGSYAQELNINKDALTKIPPTKLTHQELLPLLLQGMTAHFLVDSAYQVKSGESALVTAAAGGVGSLLVQLLVLRGVTVIACASTEERAERARLLGAEHAGTYEKMGEIVADATKGVGVNVVYDSVGKDYFDTCLGLLAPSGMYILYGAASGPVPPLELMRLNNKSLGIRRPTLATYTSSASERQRRLNELISLAEKGLIQYQPTKVFPLEQAKQAHELIESRRWSGKIGLHPWNL